MLLENIDMIWYLAFLVVFCTTGNHLLYVLSLYNTSSEKKHHLEPTFSFSLTSDSGRRFWNIMWRFWNCCVIYWTFYHGDDDPFGLSSVLLIFTTFVIFVLILEQIITALLFFTLDLYLSQKASLDPLTKKEYCSYLNRDICTKNPLNPDE